MAGYRVTAATHAATPLETCLGGRNMTRGLNTSSNAVVDDLKRSSGGLVERPLCLLQACQLSLYEAALNVIGMHINENCDRLCLIHSFMMNPNDKSMDGY